MVEVRFTWHETDRSRPALDVLVRIVALDDAYDSRELDPFLLRHDGDDGTWTGVIDLPEGLRSSYQFCPARGSRIPTSGLDDEGWAAILATGEPDPANDDGIGPSTFGNRALASILELPGAPPQPWCRRRTDGPRGTIHHEGTDRPWPSTVDIYTPAGSCEEPLPLVVLFDGQAWIGIDVASTFDNLIADAVVPPFVAVVLGAPFGPVRVRGLTRPADHLPYLLDELLPRLVRDFGATTDPARTVLAGQSLGGLAAVHAGLRAPERFGVIVSQSGSFWWPGEAEGEIGGAEVIARVADGPTVPVRFWLEAGALEEALTPGNRELQATLAVRQYAVAYREYQGGHDFACWRGGLGEGLAWAFA